MFSAKLNEVITSPKPFLRDPLNFIVLGISAFINIIHWLVLYFNIKPGQNNILLHYNVIYGTDLVDKSQYIYIIPLLALVFLAVNAGISVFFYRREKLASYFLNFGSIVIQIIFFAAAIILIVAND